MNCKKCGNVLAPTDTFCQKCGEPVTPTMPTQSVVPAPVEPVAQAMAPVTEPVAPPVMPIEGAITQAPSPAPAPIEPPPVMPQAMPTVPPTMPIDQTNGAQVNPNPAQINISEQSPVTPAPAPVQMSQPEAAEAPVKKKSSPIVVALLLIVLIAIIAYIVIYFVKPFDKSKDANNVDQTVTENTETPTATYANWMNYLLDKDISNITLERTTEDGTGDKTVTLTQDDLNNLFTKLMNFQFVKYYLQGSGFTYGDILTISYSVDENSYEIKIANGQLYADTESLKDEKLRNALEESEHTTESEDLKDTEGAFYNYKFVGYDSTIFDEYLVEEVPE